MTIQELRKLVSDFPKYPSTQMVKPASVCNEGFPGTFNLSYSEAEMIEQFGQYLDYDRDYIYTKIQPVIRFQDWKHIVESDEHSYRYLTVFDLADIGGAIILKDSSDLEQIVSVSIKAFFKFLFDTLKLDKAKLRISYFSGGKVKDVTKEKYDFDYELPADTAIKYWKELGITDDQFIPDTTRDTLLALNVFGLPTPWGFRHEVNYLHEGKLLDVGTFEYLFYRPIFKDGKVVDLKRWEHLFVISAIGLERILMIKNGFSRATDCGHMKPLIEAILASAKNQNYQQAEILCQALRGVHRIMVDCGGYDTLAAKRKEKARSFYKAIIAACAQLGIEISHENMKKLLDLNARLQDFYPELASFAELTAQEIVKGKTRLAEDRSIKHGGVAQ